MLRLRVLAVPLALSVTLAACGGGGGSHGEPAPVVPAQLTPPKPASAVSSFIYDAGTIRKASYEGPVKAKNFSLDVMLRPQNAAGLKQFAASVSDPKSAGYRHFITPQEIGQRYGASQADETAAENYFKSYGLHVAGWPQRLMLHVGGSVAALQSAFHTTFGVYRLGNTTFVGPASAPSVGVAAVIGSTNIVARARYKTSLSSGGIGKYGYTPQQVAAAFDYTGAYNAGYTGAGITIGVIGTGPIAISGQNGIAIGDVDAMRMAYHVAGSSTVVVRQVTDAAGGAAYSAAGFTAPPPVSNAGCGGPTGFSNPVTGLFASESPFEYNGQWCNPEDGETQIDTQQQALLARNATINYYLAYNPNDFCGGDVVAPAACAAGAGASFQGIAESDAEVQQAIADNSVDALSLSYGESEYDTQLFTVGNSTSIAYADYLGLPLAALAAEGIATFVSSADTGSNECNNSGPSTSLNGLCVSSPASDPSVVGVGGVTLPLNAAGGLTGPLTAWGVQTSAGVNGASGGGLSILNPVPSYQTGVTYYVPGAAPVTLPARGVPDVSLLGDPSTGIAVFIDSDPSLGGAGPLTTPAVYGGTSVAAPEMAAMWALVLQACKASASCATATGAKPYRLGNPDPLFYQIYGGGTGAKYASTFYNVQYGTNSTACENLPAPPAPATPPPAICPTAPSLNPGYTAGPGYNLVTGIGVPYGRALIKAIVGT